mgnify:CR=1 FL=1
MKGILLAGGHGTRLYPITKSVSKQLLCIYDKPMVYYPLSILILAGIKDIMIISTPDDLPDYKKLLGDGKSFGISLKYLEQTNPGGIAEAFVIAEKFIDLEDVMLVLGDNIFYGNGFISLLKNSISKVEKTKTAVIFGSYVDNPSRYGVVSFDINYNAKEIIEKPVKPDSNYAVIGLYFYPNSVIEISKQIKPSKRGELEITSINNFYLSQKKLGIEILDTQFTWLDTGTPDSLLEASNFIQTIEKRTGKKIACIEEIVYELGYINKNQLYNLCESLPSSDYVNYLKKNLNK